MTYKTTLPTQGTRNYVEWSDRYLIGIKSIDEQYKGLLSIAYNLFNHSCKNEEEEQAYFKEEIQKAVLYIKNHIAAEENFMQSMKYSDYAAYKKAHDEFTLKVVKSAK